MIIIIIQIFKKSLFSLFILAQLFKHLNHTRSHIAAIESDYECDLIGKNVDIVHTISN